MRNILIKSCLYLISAAFSLFVVWFSVSAVSCKMNEEGISVLTGDFVSPELSAFDVVSENSISLVFTEQIKPVEFTAKKIVPEGMCSENDEYIAVESTIKEFEDDDTSNGIKGRVLSLSLSEPTQPGYQYELSGIVEDNHQNTLSMSIPFGGFNCDIPVLIINEIRSEYSKTKTAIKVEFIEILAITDGNLAGIVVESAYDGDGKDYVFTNVQVKAGEYIVLHMRSMEEGCIDETGSDLSLSYATESSPAARDFWVADTSARIGKTDVITIRAKKNGETLDSVIFAESSKEVWPSQLMSESAKKAHENGIWLGSSSVADAADSTKVTVTRTLSRQNTAELVSSYAELKESGDNAEIKAGVWKPASCSSDWIVTATGKATPGEENSDIPVDK